MPIISADPILFCKRYEEISIFRLKIHIFKLQIRIFRLQIYIFSLKIENFCLLWKFCYAGFVFMFTFV